MFIVLIGEAFVLENAYCVFKSVNIDYTLYTPYSTGVTIEVTLKG